YSLSAALSEFGTAAATSFRRGAGRPRRSTERRCAMLLSPRLFGPGMLADPYPSYARLRSTHPVHWADQFGGWALTRHADVPAVLRSPNASAERTATDRQGVGAEVPAPYQ